MRTAAFAVVFAILTVLPALAGVYPPVTIPDLARIHKVLPDTNPVIQYPPDPRAVSNPWMNLKVRRVLGVSAASAAGGRGLSLASADFNEDGIPDLAAGYEASGRGMVVMRKGNPEAVYSARENAAPFDGESTSLDLPEAPDFLCAGDFNADGHFDLAGARRGSESLYWTAGDGIGGFGAPQRIELSGAMTAMVCGEMNRMDGLTDVLVGVKTNGGGKVLVFEAPDGALQRKPEEVEMPASPEALAPGVLDDSMMFSLAVAAGNDVAIIHGRDRKQTQLAQFRDQVPQPVTEWLHIGEAVADIQAGVFTQAPRQQMALLMRTGELRILSSEANAWTETSRTQLLQAGASESRLVKSHTAPLPWESLMALDGGAGRLVMPAAEMGAAEFALQGKPAAVLPMRLNRDALTDLVVLTEGAAEPVALITAPAATFTVTNTNDSGAGSLRQAITNANGTPGADAITFNIAGTGPFTIAPSSPLPAITDPVTIDATTQPGSTTGAWPPTLQIELNMTAAGPIVVANTGSGTVIKGLIVNRAPPAINYGYGFSLQSATNCIVEYNLIGTDPTGTIDLGNGGGVSMLDSSSNIIGGTTPAARNLLSGNNGAGPNATIILTGNSLFNAIEGNYIGTNITGTAALPNESSNGVLITSGAILNFVGGAIIGAGNLISNPGQPFFAAVNLSSGGNLVAGNLMGTSASGTAAIGNSVGVALTSSGNTVGGTTPLARNIISATSQYGVEVFVSAGNLIQGNYIGTNATGTAGIGNYIAILVGISTVDLLVGGNISTAGNLISSNSLAIWLYSNQSNSQILGNRIGTDASGAAPLGNGNSIYILNSSGSFIGGTGPGEGNIMAFNGYQGILVEGDATSSLNNRILGNSIFANGQLGIDLVQPGGPYNAVNPNDAGDSDTGANNFQNYPVLTSVTYSAGMISVSGTLNSESNKTYILEFFANHACDPLGNGPGERYLGNVVVTTDGSGNASFTQVLAAELNPGEVITSTATDPSGNTSEYSACLCYMPAITAASNGPVCAGSTLRLSAMPSVPGANYSWTGPNGFTSSFQNPDIQNVTVAASGIYSATASANGCSSAAATAAVTVNPAPSLSPSTLPGGTVGTAYDQTFIGSGGAAPYTFAVTSGALPGGLSLNGSTGLLSGTPAGAGAFAFTIGITDTNGCGTGNTYVILVTCPQIAITPATLPTGAFNMPYNQALTASGGTAPYTYALSGALPPGLTFAAGTLSGTPSASGVYSVTVSATDANGCNAERTYLLLIYTTISGIADSYTTALDTPLAVPAANGVLANDDDPENHSPLTAILISNPTSGSVVLNTDGSFTYTPGTGFAGTDSFVYRATDGVNESNDTPVTIDVQAAAACLFSDDFSSGTLDLSKWSVVKPAWSEPGGELTGAPTGKKAVLIGAGFSGCVDCAIETTMETDGGTGNRLWLLGWYLDKKNDVELIMKQESNKWILKYRSNGKILLKTKAFSTINPGTAYSVALSYDGAVLHLAVDGTELTTLAVPGMPAGTAGYQVKATTGHFDSLCVH